MEAQVYKSWIQGVFDRSAETYGGTNSNFFDYFAAELVALAGLHPSAHVLDVATGRGAILKHVLAAIGPAGKVVGLDFSPQMIAQTACDFQNFPNAQLVCGDAENLPFNSQSFDYVLCGFGVFFFPDITKTLNEFHRVLKPGGKLLISTWGEDDIGDIAFQEAISPFGIAGRTTLHHFDDPHFIQEILTQSSFSEIQTHVSKLDYSYSTFDNWFDSLWSHASRAKLEKLTPQQLTQLKQALKSRVTPLLQPDGFHELLHVYLTSCNKL